MNRRAFIATTCTLTAAQIVPLPAPAVHEPIKAFFKPVTVHMSTLNGLYETMERVKAEQPDLHCTLDELCNSNRTFWLL